ncbi:hypothetical protein KSP40_PGU007733 [Platanthera guangdongensis]|uniref:Exonuclease domain-containing protein n=1 Tax=Platanthera guangdongensis TaxID=2320717 RepID=A0ABR2N5H1_9ASPA
MEAAAEPSAGRDRDGQEDDGAMIAFFDVETTVPSGSGRGGGGGGGYSLLEFGAILVCPRRLIEVENFSTLIRPSDLNTISSLSIRCNGITRDSVTAAPSFGDVAHKVFSILHGRVWAGHNILRFDCARIREAFAEIGRPPPEPMGTIDTLPLLTQRFGRRAGNMKMATLATYFGLGPQKHRSLDDVRLNLEVVKYCAAVLFLESNVSTASPVKSFLTGNSTTVNCNNQSDIPAVPNLVDNLQGSSCFDNNAGEFSHDLGQYNHPRLKDDAAYLLTQIEQMRIDSSQLYSAASVKRNSASNSPDAIRNLSSCSGFLEPDDVLLNCITVTHTNLSPTVKKMHILHLNVPLWICCRDLVIHFGISTKFMDHTGRPKLSILVNAPESLCLVLSICDSLVQRSFRSFGSNSEWRSLIKKNAFTNSSTIRLHIPTISNYDATTYSTEIYRREASGDMNKLIFSKFDVAELDLLLAPGTIVDGFFCFDTYDYQQHAGIRLVAKSLVIHSR